MEEDELEESVTAGRTSVPGEEGRESTPEREDVGRLDVDTGYRNPLPQSVRILDCRNANVQMITSTQTVPRGLDYHGEPEQQLQRLFLDCGVQPEKVGPPEDLANLRFKSSRTICQSIPSQPSWSIGSLPKSISFDTLSTKSCLGSRSKQSTNMAISTTPPSWPFL
jgi:hypothetical protein